jgi:hypothetical protein
MQPSECTVVDGILKAKKLKWIPSAFAQTVAATGLAQEVIQKLDTEPTPQNSTELVQHRDAELERRKTKIKDYPSYPILPS